MTTRQAVAKERLKQYQKALKQANKKGIDNLTLSELIALCIYKKQ